jgi:hypothetical protein
MFHPRLLVAAVLALDAGPMSAQVTSIDEGSFTIIRDGERAGREDFSIRSAPSVGGRVLVAQGNLVMGGRRLAPALNADTSGFPVRYQMETRLDGRTFQTLSVQVSRNHYEARISREDGESAREFRLPPGTVASEDDVIHQLWFVARRGAGVVVPVLVPSRSVVESVTVELAGTERLTIDGREFEARHFVLRSGGAGSSGGRRDVWVDAGGRMLKAAIPALRLVAVRDEAPR